MFVMQLIDASGPELTTEDWYEQNGYLFLDCKKAEKALPDVYILIEGKWYTITAKHLLNLHRSSGKGKKKIEICILGWSSGKKIEEYRVQLGVAFLKGYYTIFDLDKNRVGIAPNSDSSKFPAFKGEIPDQVLTRIYD